MEPYILVAFIATHSRFETVKMAEFQTKDFCEKAKTNFVKEHEKAGGYTPVASKSFCFKAVGLLKKDGDAP